ncbi:enoyl-CoA hydratase/isomerase family protein [Chloroflexota bacterium]
MKHRDIIYTRQEGIATITLNRPELLNAFSLEMRDSIVRAVKDASKDDGVRVLVITGAGRAFSSGGNVKNTIERMSQRSQTERSNKGRQFQPSIILRNFDKPVIAAINGVAAGGGLDLALSCDIRIASDKARFSEVYIRRGIIPPTGGTYLLPRLVGIDKACLLIWTGDMVDAKEAERIGLVTMVVPHSELENATKELADKLAKGPPLAIRRAKRAIYEGLAMEMEPALKVASSLVRELWGTEDHEEGLRAFIEKREPVFKGK